MKENKSKWYYIVHNFLNSGREVLKLYEPHFAYIALFQEHISCIQQERFERKLNALQKRVY